MRFTTTSPNQLFTHLFSKKPVEIHTHPSPNAVTALHILTTQLEKHLITYSATIAAPDPKSNAYKIFISMRNPQGDGLSIDCPNTPATMDSLSTEKSCESVNAVLILYELARYSNLVDIDIAWAALVTVEFYAQFLNRKRCLSGLATPLFCCASCAELHQSCIAKIGGSLFLKEELDFHNLNVLDLFSSVSTDLDIVAEKKLFVSNSAFATADSRVKELFVDVGISNLESKELIVNISGDAMRRVRNKLRRSILCHKKMGDGTVISTVQQFFMIFSNLVEGRVENVLGVFKKRDKIVVTTENKLNSVHVNRILKNGFTTEDKSNPINNNLLKMADLYIYIVEIIKNYFYRIKRIRSYKLLIFNEKIRGVESQFMRMLLMLVETLYRRLGEECRVIVVNEGLERALVSGGRWIKKYVAAAEATQKDLDGCVHEIRNENLNLFYRKLYRRE